VQIFPGNNYASLSVDGVVKEIAPRMTFNTQLGIENRLPALGWGSSALHLRKIMREIDEENDWTALWGEGKTVMNKLNNQPGKKYLNSNKDDGKMSRLAVNCPHSV
jgi:hypothetical protein